MATRINQTSNIKYWYKGRLTVGGRRLVFPRCRATYSTQNTAVSKGETGRSRHIDDKYFARFWYLKIHTTFYYP